MKNKLVLILMIFIAIFSLTGCSENIDVTDLLNEIKSLKTEIAELKKEVGHINCTSDEWISNNDGTHKSICQNCDITVVKNCKYDDEECYSNRNGTHEFDCVDCGARIVEDCKYGEEIETEYQTYKICEDCGYKLVIQESSLSLATQKATNALKDYFTRVATISTTDQVDVIGDLAGYTLVVENGAGKVDYKFTVNADGSLSTAVKGDHTSPKFGDDTLATLVTAASYTNAKAVDANGCADGIDGLNGVAIYATGTNQVTTPLA